MNPIYIINPVINNLKMKGGKTDALSILQVIAEDKTLYSEMSTEEKMNLVKILLDTEQKKFTPHTPSSLYDLLFQKEKVSPDKKILLPEVKSGGLLLETLFKLHQNSKDINYNFFKNIMALSVNSDTKKFVSLAVEFIFGQEFIAENSDFLQKNIQSRFDIVLCNPPFGITEINSNNILNGRKIPTEFLFLKKIKTMLAENGGVSIIVPNSLLEIETYAPLREWIKSNYSIKSVLSLPIGTFKPYTNIKTSILFLQSKISIQEKAIKLLIAENENKLLQKDFITFEVSYEDFDIKNFSPEYYLNQQSNELQVFNTVKFKTIAEICQIKKEKAAILKNFSEEINYIDISSVDSKTGLIKEARKIPVKEAPKRAYYEVKAGNLIVAVSGGGIGSKSHSIAVIDENHSRCICSNGFRVLELNENINPYYLWYFMRSEFFLKQVKLLACGSTILNLKENDFLSLKVVIPPIEVQNHIAKKVCENIKILTEADKFLCENENEIKNIMKGCV